MSETPTEVDTSPEISFNQLFSGEIPNIVGSAKTITSEEVFHQISYLKKHGVVVEKKGGWNNAGFRKRDGKIVMNIPDDTPANSLHEAVHIQHILDAKAHGVSTRDIERRPIYQKCLTEIIASSAAISLLGRLGKSKSQDAQIEQINIDLNKKQLVEECGLNPDDIFVSDDPLEFKINPYLWHPTTTQRYA